MTNWSLLGRPSELGGFLFTSTGRSDQVREYEKTVFLFFPGPYRSSVPVRSRISLPTAGPSSLPSLRGPQLNWTST